MLCAAASGERGYSLMGDKVEVRLGGGFVLGTLRTNGIGG
jgi:hypothetical protein